MKKVMAFLLATILLISIVPIPSSAGGGSVKEYILECVDLETIDSSRLEWYPNGRKITSNAGEIIGTEGVDWNWDEPTKTLTLGNAKFITYQEPGNGWYYGCISLPPDSTVILAEGTVTELRPGSACALGSIKTALKYGNLDISGKGKLIGTGNISGADVNIFNTSLEGFSIDYYKSIKIIDSTVKAKEITHYDHEKNGGFLEIDNSFVSIEGPYIFVWTGGYVSSVPSRLISLKNVSGGKVLTHEYVGDSGSFLRREDYLVSGESPDKLEASNIVGFGELDPEKFHGSLKIVPMSYQEPTPTLVPTITPGPTPPTPTIIPTETPIPTSAPPTPTSFPTATPAPWFSDIPENQYYTVPVAWAVAEGITKGTGGGKFSPAQGCTRAQIVTFLWRSMGRPTTGASSNFTDMPTEPDFVQAINWAVESGITKGTGGGKFSPNTTCTREQAVTFIWRANGKPAAAKPSSFIDAPKSGDFKEAIDWAVENGITKGAGGGKFLPKKTCTRGDIVTFIYRSLVE